MYEIGKSEKLTQHVIRQINNIFGLEKKEINILMSTGGQKAYDSTLMCLNEFSNKYNCENINPYNSVMYCIYLYWYAKEMATKGWISIADRIYYLNKMLNSVDLFYEIDLPEVWSCEHPVGSVMGRANYGNNFYFYQNCTVGGSVKKDGSTFYPNLGSNVWMLSYSRIIGDCTIGNNVVLSTGAAVVNQNVPSDVIVFGRSPNLIFKKNKRKKQFILGCK